MFYLFIFESIGTSELMLIGLVALIVFGPRKLPELARTIGKTMAEFRRSSDEFKRTWEQEIAFEENKKSPDLISDISVQNTRKAEQTINRDFLKNNENLVEPKIKEINKEDFDKKLTDETESEKQIVVSRISDKKDWL